MLKADGTPMSRQQIHMLRKKARGICMICSEPAVGVYCMKHTIAVRERMRKKLKYRRRLLNSASYAPAKGTKKAAKPAVKVAVKAAVKAPVKAVKAVKSVKAVKAVAKKAAPKAQKSATKGKSKK